MAVLSAAAGLLLLAGWALAAPDGAAAAAPGACPAAATVPASAASAARSERALLCLINRERARYDLPALRANRCLARAADGHVRDMVRNRYFSHDSQDGRGFDDRILATGYAPQPERWTLGENLAWGVAPGGDPAWVLDAWMDSRGHRANVLRGSFREAGVAAVPGAPVALGAGPVARATYAVDFGAHTGGGGHCS